MPTIPTLLEMLKAGMHFGHQKAKWHPKMQSYIYGVRQGIHIIDLEKTSHELTRSLNFLREIVASGGKVLLVSLKDQADVAVTEAAGRTQMPYIVGRWLGGVFTNWGVISKLIRRMELLEAEQQRGGWTKYSKREQLDKQRDLDELITAVGGIRTLTKLPQVVFVVGTREGKNAIHEANKVKVPVVAMVDTNTNPAGVDYIIPANDDALKSIQMVMSLVSDAIMEGQKLAADQIPIAVSAPKID